MKKSNKGPKVVVMPATPTVYKVDTINQPVDVKTSGVTAQQPKAQWPVGRWRKSFRRAP